MLHEIIKNLNLNDSAVIYYGLEKGLLTSADVAQYFVDTGLFAQHLKVARFIGNEESYTLLDILDLIKSVDSNSKEPNLERAERIWLLATLIQLSESKLTDQEKIVCLQGIYSDFNYPEEMASCSIYNADGKDPIVALNKAILQIQKQVMKKRII